MTKIKIIELHISNICSYRCKICSKDYGGDNQPLADITYIQEIINNLQRDDDKKIVCDVLQTGGCGDAFLNPNYIKYLRMLREALPDQKICLYSNFSMVTPQIAEILIKEQLLDQIQVRIDSFNPGLYKYCTTGDIEKVKQNIKYFFSINDNIEFTFIYFPIYKYTQAVRNKLNKEPTYFSEDEVKDLLKDEYSEMLEWFNQLPNKRFLKHRISGIAFWRNARIVIVSQVKQKYAGIYLHVKMCLTKFAKLYPNGNVGLCAYDSLQDTFIYGNFLQTALADIWNSQEKKDMIKRIEDGEFYGKWPCVNARSCDFENV